MLPKLPKTILVTGFAPFGGEKINPSWQIVKALPDMLAGYRVEKLLVPTEFGQSIAVVTSVIEKLKPALILCLGQAGSRAAMSIERIAINVNDASIADNAGVQPVDTAIVEHAPAAYFCTLPLKAMMTAMITAGAPAEISNTAGTFVCNHLIYGVLHHLAIHQSASRAGFMHVPFLESQILNRADTAALSLAAMVEGTKAAIIAAIQNHIDIKIVGGKLH